MILLWIAAALFSALASTFIVFRSARAAAAAEQPGEDPALAVYRRQLAEIDDLAERGLLPEDEHRSAQTEASRRLLSAADTAPAPPQPSKASRWTVVAFAAAVPVVAAGLYIAVGSPRTPDQPFAARLAKWTDDAKTDPRSLTPPQLVAVLTQVLPKYPKDPDLLYQLARFQADSGDLASAEHSLRKAIGFAPNRADLWSSLGALLASKPGGDNAPDEVDAFRHALALDPANPEARYYLARARIASGDVDGGLADWKTLVAGLKPDDPRVAVVNQDMAVVEKTRALPVSDDSGDAGQAAPAGGDQQQAFIHAMVDRLAAKLKSQPDDPAGWARLIRSYGVLGDKANQAAALASAHALFKSRPDDLRMVDAAASPPQ